MPRSDRSLVVAAIFGLATIFFSAGLALGGDWTSKSYEQAEHPHAPAEVYAAADLGSSFAAYPVEESNRCYSSPNHDVADLCAQWRAAIAAEKAADAAMWSNRLSIIGAALTSVGLIFVWVTFRETRRTAEAAFLGVKEAQRAADAAHQANIETRFSQRAWMAYNGVTYEVVDKEDKITCLNFKVNWNNAGQTPAQYVRQMGGTPIVDKEANFAEFGDYINSLRASVKNDEKYSFIGPGSLLNSHSMTLNRADVVGMMAGDIRAFIWSEVRYRDIFEPNVSRESCVILEIIFHDDKSGRPEAEMARVNLRLNVVGSFNKMT